MPNPIHNNSYPTPAHTLSYRLLQDEDQTSYIRQHDTITIAILTHLVRHQSLCFNPLIFTSIAGRRVSRRRLHQVLEVLCALQLLERIEWDQYQWFRDARCNAFVTSLVQRHAIHTSVAVPAIVLPRVVCRCPPGRCSCQPSRPLHSLPVGRSIYTATEVRSQPPSPVPNDSPPLRRVPSQVPQPVASPLSLNVRNYSWGSQISDEESEAAESLVRVGRSPPLVWEGRLSDDCDAEGHTDGLCGCGWARG